MKLVTAKELADVVGVHLKTVYKWRRCGIIVAIQFSARCIRFDLDDCLAKVAHTTQPTGY